MKRENLKKYGKFGLSVIIAGIACHLFITPTILSNETALNKTINCFTKKQNIEIKIKNPKLRTYLSPRFEICADDIVLNKDSNTLFETKNLNTDFCLSFKKLIVNKIHSDYIFADINGLMSLASPK